MRKHLYLVVDHPNDDLVGNIEVTDSRKPRSAKNEQTTSDKRNVETGEFYQQTNVSLGYVDYENEDEYEDQIVDDMKRKLVEIDERHLHDAGLDPDEVLNRGDA